MDKPNNIYKDVDILDALIKSEGVLSDAAKILGCSRTTLYSRIEEDENIKTTIDELRNQMEDKYEKRYLEILYISTNPKDWEFFLKTKLKHRGYVSEEKSNNQININLTERVIKSNE